MAWGTKEVEVHEVFGVARDVPLNYVKRVKVDGLFVAALKEHKHLVIHGSSKQGKTSLRKNTLDLKDYAIVTCSNKWKLADLHSAILKAVGYRLEGASSRTLSGDVKLSASLEAKAAVPLMGGVGVKAGAEASEGTQDTFTDAPMELDPSDVNDIIDALGRARAPKLLVLEDFHYLPEETQVDFAVALKAFHESSDYCFIVVGVWLDENRLIAHNGDLGGRLLSINADRWSEAELRQVVTDGADLLNVQFDTVFVDALVAGALKSVWIVQEVCLRACQNVGVTKRQRHPTAVTGDSAALIAQVVGQDTARYRGFISRFADGIQSTTLEMYRWLILSVLLADTDELAAGLTYAWLTKTINAHHPTAPINAGNLTQALSSTTSLQSAHMKIKPLILDYDATARRLTVVDRTFMLWLQSQDRAAIISELEVR